ncbi:MAG: putative motility protein [Rhodocyclaceae bacterium]|jgi:hypothetical protein|nr:MAG: putative motility protein [Rhodocyclaceae bacterium]
MDIGSVTSSGGAMAREQLAEQVDLRVLRKAIEITEQSAEAMIEALPAAPPASNPPNLGNSVDTYA